MALVTDEMIEAGVTALLYEQGNNPNATPEEIVWAILNDALSQQPPITEVERAWREGWSTGYNAGYRDGRAEGTYWCDVEADWRESKTREALSTSLIGGGE